MIDWDILASPGFVILLILGWSATFFGWIWSKKTESMVAFSIPTLLIILVVEAAAAYIFAARG